MPIKLISSFITRSMKLIHLKIFLYSCLLFLFLGSIIFSVFYITSSYESLVKWFLNLNDCFYKRAVWQQEFFSPLTKIEGNKFSITTVIVSCCGFIFSTLKLKQIIKHKTATRVCIFPSKDNAVWYFFFLPIAGLLWYYNHSFILPWYDEVFSGIFIAELHPFQTLAYYMLPNNHVFFNLLNNLLFFWTEEKILTGRILSLFAYVGILWCAFYWLNKLITIKWLAFSVVILLAMQYPVWSFASQARGYELQLLMSWICFISIEQYFEQKINHWWMLFSLASVIGFITVPSFLFYYAACLCYVLFRMWQTKNVCWFFWKNQLLMAALVLLFYLPSICFSGINAITHNQYVSPEVSTVMEYLPILGKMFQRYILYCFAFNHENLIGLNYVLFFMPFILFFMNNKTAQRLAVFYVLQWLVFAVLNIKMLSAVPPRTMLVQICFTFAFGVLAIYYLFNSLFKKNQQLVAAFSALFVFVLGFHFFNTQRYSLNQLYGPETNKTYQVNETGIKQLPEGNTVAFSDESFLWIYLVRQKNNEIHSCAQGNETFYVKRTAENLPQQYQGYQLYSKAEDFYEIYKRVDYK